MTDNMSANEFTNYIGIGVGALTALYEIGAFLWRRRVRVSSKEKPPVGLSNQAGAFADYLVDAYSQVPTEKQSLDQPCWIERHDGEVRESRLRKAGKVLLVHDSKFPSLDSWYIANPSGTFSGTAQLVHWWTEDKP